ncbi:hypothetical protein JCM11491_006326 [Sporobolomyces phaffii]
MPILHAAKHPTQTVCGLLVGTSTSISDAIPLLHHWTELSAMMEVALQLAETHVKQRGLEILGVYVANERIGDLDVPLALGRVADSIKRNYQHALVLVIDNEKLNSNATPFIPHLNASSSWTPSPKTTLRLEPEEPHAWSTAVRTALESNRQALVGDFDDHLEDRSVDWLTNSKLSAAAA